MKNVKTEFANVAMHVPVEKLDIYQELHIFIVTQLIVFANVLKQKMLVRRVKFVIRLQKDALNVMEETLVARMIICVMLEKGTATARPIVSRD